MGEKKTSVPIMDRRVRCAASRDWRAWRSVDNASGETCFGSAYQKCIGFAVSPISFVG